MTNSFAGLRSVVTLTLSGLLLGAVTGCKVGPNYKRPAYPAPPAAFRGADEAAVTSDAQSSIGDQKWASVYQEPELQELIRKALANNYDVRITAERILEQESQVQITRSQEFPTISVGGTGLGATFPSAVVGGSSNSSSTNNNSNGGFSSPLVSGAFSLSAAWTPDFWGLYRRQTESARAQLLATTWAQRAVKMTLVQEVATGYIQIRALDKQLDIAKQTLKVRQDSVELTSTLEKGGSAPLSDVRQAEQLLYGRSER